MATTFHIAMFPDPWAFKTGKTLCGQRKPNAVLLTPGAALVNCTHCNDIWRAKTKALRLMQTLGATHPNTLAAFTEIDAAHARAK
jgi:hypothetical protein